MTDWLNPLNKIKLQRAVKAKAPQVILPIEGEQRTFTLDYKRRKGEVHVSPTTPVGDGNNEFVPRGYFNIKAVSDVAWVGE